MNYWENKWSEYANAEAKAAKDFGRGDADCAALCAGWASIVSGHTVSLPPMTDEGMEAFLRDRGGVQSVVAAYLSPVGYTMRPTPRAWPYGIAVFETRHDRFPVGVGVLVGNRLATLLEGRAGVAYVWPDKVNVLHMWNHDNLSEVWG